MTYPSVEMLPPDWHHLYRQLWRFAPILVFSVVVGLNHSGAGFALGIDHPAYQAQAVVDEPNRSALVRDLAG